MTAEFRKNLYQKTNLKDLRLGIKKVLEKSQIGWRQMILPSLPSGTNFLLTAVKNYTL